MQAIVKKYLGIFLCLALFFSASGLALEAFLQETGQQRAPVQELQRQGGALNTRIQQLTAARDRFQTLLEDGAGNPMVLSREVSNMQAELDLLEPQVRTLERHTQEFLSTNQAHSSKEILEKNVRDALNALGLTENPYVPVVSTPGAPGIDADAAITSSADFRKALEDRFEVLGREFEETRTAWSRANQAIAANADASKLPQLLDEFAGLDQKMSSLYFELRQTANALDIPQNVFEQELEHYLTYEPPTAQEVVDLTRLREQLRAEAKALGLQVAGDVDDYTRGLGTALPATQNELAELGAGAAELDDLAEAALATEGLVSGDTLNEQAFEKLPAKQRGIIARMKEKTPQLWGEFKSWCTGNYESMRALKERVGEGISKLTGKIREIKSANRRLGSPTPEEHLTIEQHIEQADNLIEYADAQIQEIEERYGLHDSSSKPVLTDADQPAPPQGKSRGIVVTKQEAALTPSGHVVVDVDTPEITRLRGEIHGLLAEIEDLRARQDFLKDYTGPRTKNFTKLESKIGQDLASADTELTKKTEEIKNLWSQEAQAGQGLRSVSAPVETPLAPQGETPPLPQAEVPPAEPPTPPPSEPLVPEPPGSGPAAKPPSSEPPPGEPPKPPVKPPSTPAPEITPAVPVEAAQTVAPQIGGKTTTSKGKKIWEILTKERHLPFSQAATKVTAPLKAFFNWTPTQWAIVKPTKAVFTGKYSPVNYLVTKPAGFVGKPIVKAIQPIVTNESVVKAFRGLGKALFVFGIFTEALKLVEYYKHGEGPVSTSPPNFLFAREDIERDEETFLVDFPFEDNAREGKDKIVLRIDSRNNIYANDWEKIFEGYEGGLTDEKAAKLVKGISDISFSSQVIGLTEDVANEFSSFIDGMTIYYFYQNENNEWVPFESHEAEFNAENMVFSFPEPKDAPNGDYKYLALVRFSPLLMATGLTDQESKRIWESGLFRLCMGLDAEKNCPLAVQLAKKGIISESDISRNFSAMHSEIDSHTGILNSLGNEVDNWLSSVGQEFSQGTRDFKDWKIGYGAWHYGKGIVWNGVLGGAGTVLSTPITVPTTRFYVRDKLHEKIRTLEKDNYWRLAATYGVPVTGDFIVTGKETVTEEIETPSPGFEEELVDLEGIIVQITREDWEALRDRKIPPLTLETAARAIKVTVSGQEKKVEIKMILDQPRIFVHGVKPGDHAVFEFRFTDSGGKEVIFRKEYTIPSRVIWVHGWFSGIKETAPPSGCGTVKGCLAVIGKEFAKRAFD